MKVVAQRLFALHGVDSISVKDIVASAGQRNNASLHYHFGSKEALIGELLLDGAIRVDARRQAMLDELEEEGGPRSVRDVLEALIRPVDQLTYGDERDNTYIRFLANLQAGHRDLVRHYLGDQWNVGYRRCLDHLRRLLHEFPAPLLEQRMSLIGIYANAIFAAKEAAMDVTQPNRFWAPKYTIENIIDSLQAVVECTPSALTLSLLDAPESKGGAHKRKQPSRSRPNS
ncbi:TetR/AcrR family transcriptional regulator [Cupriavidus lacunae]|uniref:TetR/AcrR family transcriptional regulator n=1 Tax=Cupriavidus lacunae TaxID=2666307 RepID=A0A370P2A9_9BURK|nr:TetR/AcrR family transcriptional regulator [Cupriavidus lacunae]